MDDTIRSERTVPAAVVDVLDEAGVPIALCLSGGYVGSIIAALHEHPRVRALQIRQEALGTIIAEAYGRLTGRPLVVIGQGEWIAGNAGQGLIEALTGSSPLVILTEMSDGGPLSHHAPYQSGTGDYGSWDARGALAGMTKRVMVAHYPAQAVQLTQLALKHALTGDPGPVAVIFHGQSLRGRVDATAKPRVFATRRYLPPRSRALDDQALDDAAAVLRQAERPVVIAGNGVRVGQACSSLLAFADHGGLPILTTAGGKGVFPEVHPCSGGTIGTFGHRSANELLRDADVVLAVGTRLAPMDTADEDPRLLDPDRQTLIQVDVEPLNVGWTYPVDHALVGDAAAVLERLAESAHGLARPMSAPERIAEVRARHRDHADDSESSSDVPLAPQVVIRALQDALPDDGIVTCDAGENRLFMMQWFHPTNPGGYLQPAAGGGMGYAIPAAIGAKLAHPDKPVVAVCGDGGFAMSMHGLMMAVQDRLPVTVVVFNNGALGWVLHGMGERATTATLGDFDHAAIARAIGCRGVQVTSRTALDDALLDGIKSDVAFVIDVPTSLATSFKDVQAVDPSRPQRSP
jgi:acetolactate synthase-1/2/3 large subunit